MERIWDLKPDDGGAPVLVVVGNPNEAIARHPERYSRKAPVATEIVEEEPKVEE